MNISLLEHRKCRVAVYMRVATKEQLLSPARNVKANQTNKSYATAKQFMETKYDYQGLSKSHSLIRKFIKNNR